MAEIIRRVYELTTTNFKLTIVDNDSDTGFTDALREAIKGRGNAELVLQDRNTYWGPGVNRAFRNAPSDVLIYVCSREGFALRRGWERELINHIRAHRDVALAGHLVSSPAFPTGESYTRQPWFGGFRNKHFAEQNPDREFFHVQGGLFALRRTAFSQCGGFSEVVSQDAVDIEYSHLLESHGWKLGKVARIPSVTKKTLPPVHAHLDDSTVAAHPLSLESIDLAQDVASGRSAFCNVCAWAGDSFRVDGPVPDTCPECGSTPFGRALYRYLASSSLPFRKLDCAAILDDESVGAELERMFLLTRVPPEALDRGLGSRDLVIADFPEIQEGAVLRATQTIADAVRNGGVAIGGRPLTSEPNGRDSAVVNAFERAGLGTERVSYASRAVRFAPEGLLIVRPNRDSVTLPEGVSVG
jgi:Glycosyl transferase family 2